MSRRQGSDAAVSTPSSQWFSALYADDRPRSLRHRIATRWTGRTRRLPRPAAVVEEQESTAWMTEVLRRIPA